MVKLPMERSPGMEERNMTFHTGRKDVGVWVKKRKTDVSAAGGISVVYIYIHIAVPTTTSRAHT
jgi:hypothetical protein